MLDQAKRKSPILISKNIDIKNNNQLPLFLIHPGGGVIACYNDLALSIDSRMVYGIEFPYHEVKDTHETPHFKMEWLANLYAQKITSIVKGPCLIGGWSAGGAIAYATAKRMEQLGYSIPLVVMIDSACPNVYHEQKDKIGKINYQALSFFLDNLNGHFIEPVLLDQLISDKIYNLNMHLPDLMRFIYENLDIKNLIKKETSIEVLDKFVYTIEGIARAVLDFHIAKYVIERQLSLPMSDNYDCRL